MVFPWKLAVREMRFYLDTWILYNVRETRTKQKKPFVVVVVVVVHWRYCLGVKR
jgi:hypothetical protein